MSKGTESAGVADPEVDKKGEEPAPEAPPQETADQKVARLEKELESERENTRKDREAREQTERQQREAGKQRYVTAAELRATSEETRKALETQYGRPFDQILAHVENFERSQEAAERTELKARLAERDAIDDMSAKDAQASKLKPLVREYLKDVPASEKADPTMLQKHMDRAVNYAKGKLGVAGAAKPKGGSPVKEPKPGEGDDAPDFGNDREGAVGYGSKELIPGTFRINIEPLAAQAAENRGLDGDKYRASIAHPTDPNGVMFKGKDQEPRFR